MPFILSTEQLVGTPIIVFLVVTCYILLFFLAEGRIVYKYHQNENEMKK